MDYYCIPEPNEDTLHFFLLVDCSTATQRGTFLQPHQRCGKNKDNRWVNSFIFLRCSPRFVSPTSPLPLPKDFFPSPRMVNFRRTLQSVLHWSIAEGSGLTFPEENIFLLKNGEISGEVSRPVREELMLKGLVYFHPYFSEFDGGTKTCSPKNCNGRFLDHVDQKISPTLTIYLLLKKSSLRFLFSVATSVFRRTGERVQFPRKS